MPYDPTQDAAANPNTTFIQPPADTPATTQTAPAAQPQQQPQEAIPVQAPATSEEGSTPVPKVADNTGAPAPSGAASQQQPQEPAPFPPPVGASGQPQQALQTAQSAPTPQTMKPLIDPRPWALMQQKEPEIADYVRNASEITGVSPEKIAGHMWQESHFNLNAPRGADGEIGPMQILPSTAAKYTAGGRLDPFNPHDNIIMAATYMRDLDNRFGKDSFASVAHYNGSGPKAVAYARRMMPGAPDSAEMTMHAKPGTMTPTGLVKAGVSGGPDGFFQYAVQNAPAGTAPSDVWRQAEATLVQAFIERGDIAGAQHARDFVLQQSHVGSNMWLMQAYNQLANGDGVGAAKSMAKAHAFFPDDTIGRFRTDGRNVWADRIDEGTGQRLGPSVQITPDSIKGLLNQTTDPAKFVQTLNENQKAAAQARMEELHGDYYGGLNQTRQNIADTNAAARLGAAQIRANRQGAMTPEQINKDVEERYGELAAPDMSPTERAMKAETHAEMLREGMTGTQAQSVMKGLSDKTLGLLRLQDGNYGVVDLKGGKPVAYLPSAIGDKLAPPQQPPQRSPIGSGAGTPYAMGAGINSNLTGTVMPQQQAIPTSPTPPDQSSAVPR